MTILMTLLAVLAMVLVDQVVKYWAVTVLAPDRKSTRLNSSHTS